jgi:hypothetical protein
VGSPDGHDKGSTDVALALASRSDPSGDGEVKGEVPAYAEMTGASIRGLGDDVELTVTFAESLPEKMPDEDTSMSVRFQLTGRDDAPYLYADGDKKGWAAGINAWDEYPGEFWMAGNKLIFRLPWDALGGAQRFEWYANDSWVETDLATTSYLFDEVPNLDRARYP